MISKTEKRKRIHYRIRKKVNGTSDRPRLSVYRSNSSIYCQLIDDTKGVTLASASSKEIDKGNKGEQAQSVGKLIAERAKGLNIESAVMDRGGFLFHGRVKALADGAKEGGLHI